MDRHLNLFKCLDCKKKWWDNVELEEEACKFCQSLNVVQLPGVQEIISGKD